MIKLHVKDAIKFYTSFRSYALTSSLYKFFLIKKKRLVCYFNRCFLHYGNFLSAETIGWGF